MRALVGPSGLSPSSKDAAVFRGHLREASDAGIGVLVLSWWGPSWRPHAFDGQGVRTDAALEPLFEAAAAELPATGVRLAIHLEPYPGRSATTVREDVAYLLGRVGTSPALFREEAGRPVFYVYDSYHVPNAEWKEVLGRPGGWAGAAADARAAEAGAAVPEGSLPRRALLSGGGTPPEPFERPFMLALWLAPGDGPGILEAGFDGFYTYFASEAVSYGAGGSSLSLLRPPLLLARTAALTPKP